MPDIFVDVENEADIAIHEEKPEVKATSIDDVLSSRPYFFSAYHERPALVSLTDKLDGEELLLFLRKHLITNVPWMLKAVLIALIPVIVWIAQSIAVINTDFLPPTFTLIILIFYYFFILSGYVFVNIITWFYNISIVTNVRIIDIDFSSLVFENVSATKISQVEDVEYSQIGVIRSIFDYGDVTVQTAGTASNFEFLAVPHPERVVKIIHNLMGGKHHA